MSDFPPTNTGSGFGSGPDGAFERFLSAAIATIITIMFSWRMLLENENANEQETYNDLRRQILEQTQASNANGSGNSNISNHHHDGRSSALASSLVTDSSRNVVSLMARAGVISETIKASKMTSARGPDPSNRVVSGSDNCGNVCPYMSSVDQKTLHVNSQPSSSCCLPPAAQETSVVHLTSTTLCSKEPTSYDGTPYMSGRLPSCIVVADTNNLDSNGDHSGQPPDSLIDSGYYEAKTESENVRYIRDDISLDGVETENDDDGDDECTNNILDSFCTSVLPRNVSNETFDRDNKTDEDSWGNYDWEEDAYSRVNSRRSPREFTTAPRTKSESSGSDQSYTAVSDNSDNDFSEVAFPNCSDVANDTYSNREYKSIIENEEFGDVMSQNIRNPQQRTPKMEISDDSDSDSDSSESVDFGDYEPEVTESDKDPRLQDPEVSSPLEPIIEEDSDDDIDDDNDDGKDRFRLETGNIFRDRAKNRPLSESNQGKLTLYLNTENNSDDNDIITGADKEHHDDKDCSSNDEVDNHRSAPCFVNIFNAKVKDECDNTGINIGHTSHSREASSHKRHESEYLLGVTEVRPSLKPILVEADDTLVFCSHFACNSEDGGFEKEFNSNTGGNLTENSQSTCTENTSIADVSSEDDNEGDDFPIDMNLLLQEKLDTTADTNSLVMFTKTQLRLEGDDIGQSSLVNDSPLEISVCDKNNQILPSNVDTQGIETLAEVSPPASPIRTCALDDHSGYVSDESCSSGSVVTCISVRSFDGERLNGKASDLYHDHAQNLSQDGERTPEHLSSSDEYCSEPDECLKDTEETRVTKSDSVIHIPNIVDKSRETSPGGEKFPLESDNNLNKSLSDSNRKEDVMDFSYCDFVKELHASSTSEGNLFDQNFLEVSESDVDSIDISNKNDVQLPTGNNEINSVISKEGVFACQENNSCNSTDNEIDVLSDVDKAYVNESNDSDRSMSELNDNYDKMHGNEIDGTFYITSNILQEEPVYTDSDDDDDNSEGPREYNPYDDDFAHFDEDDEDSFFMFVRRDDNQMKKLETLTNLNDLELNQVNDDYSVEKKDDGTIVFTKTQELYTDHHIRLYTTDRVDIPEKIDEENGGLETKNGGESHDPFSGDLNANGSFYHGCHIPNGDMYSIAEEDENSNKSDSDELEDKCKSDKNLCENINSKSKVPNLDLATYLISEKHKSPSHRTPENNFDFKSSEESLSAELSPSSESFCEDLRIAEDGDSGIQCSSASPTEMSKNSTVNKNSNTDINEMLEKLDISTRNAMSRSSPASLRSEPFTSVTKTDNSSQMINVISDCTLDESVKHSVNSDENSERDLQGTTNDTLNAESKNLPIDDCSTMDVLENALKPCIDQYTRTVDRQNSQEDAVESKFKTKTIPDIGFTQSVVIRKSLVKPSSYLSPGRGSKAKISRSQSQKIYKSVLTEPIHVVNRPTSLMPELGTKNIPPSRQKIISSRQKFLSADNVSQDAISPKFEQFKLMSTSNTSLPRQRIYTPKRDHSTRSLKSLNFDRPDYITCRIASRSSKSDDSFEKPEIDHLHQNCIFSPHKHEEIISINESIENLNMHGLFRYASVSSLIETDLDTGETIETRIFTDFDIFELQHEPLQRTASLGDLVHKMRDEQKPSTSSGRFANRNRPKSKSLMTLETDIDEACAAVGEGNLQRTPSVHELRVAKSLQKLNVPDWYKKSSVSRSGSTYSLFERRDSTSTINSIGYAPSVISSPLPSLSPTNTPVVIKTRVTPSATRLLRSPKLPITPEKSPIPTTSFQLPSQKLRQRDKGREPMPVPVVPFSQLRKMFENKSSEAPKSPSSPTPTSPTFIVQKTPSLKTPEKPKLTISSPLEMMTSSEQSPISSSESKKVSFEEDVKPVVNVKPVDSEPPRNQGKGTVENGKMNNESYKTKPAIPDKPKKDKSLPKKSDEFSPKKGFFSGGLRMPRLGRSSKSSHSKMETTIDKQTVEEKLQTVIEPSLAAPEKPEKSRKETTV